MWRKTSTVNYQVNDADQSPLTNTKTSLFTTLPNDLAVQVPFWSYTLYSQLGYSQFPDGVAVQASTYHVVAAVEQPVRETKIVDLQLSYLFEDSEDDGDEDSVNEGGNASRHKRLSDAQLPHYVTKHLREHVKTLCSGDGIIFQDVENFELGYIRFLYQNQRGADVDLLCKMVSKEPTFRGSVHSAKRFLADLCFQV